MISKKYCFAPADNKKITIYEANSIQNIENGVNESLASLIFMHKLDDADRAKVFFLDENTAVGGVDNKNYFNSQILPILKNMFKISEIINYKIELNNPNIIPQIEFTIYLDADGGQILSNELIDKNKNNTIIGHTYTYNFYKRSFMQDF